MKRVLPLLLTTGVLLSPATALSAAFEEHSSWDTEPWLETEKGISKGMAVLEMTAGLRFLTSNQFFNSNEKLQAAPSSFDMIFLDFSWYYGFTENWTFWTHVPIVWSELTTAGAHRETEGKIGDCETGIIYQFFRRSDPTLSMGIGLRWKLPTGSETPGAETYNITGTGTTDVELSFLSRFQVWKYLSVGASFGYNLRFPETVQYIVDRHTSITNAGLDLGDEIYGQIDIVGGIKWVALQVSGRFTWRNTSAMALAEYRTETVRWTNPATGLIEETELLLFNGARYEDWEVVTPEGGRASNDGYLFTLTPSLIIRPLDWIDLVLFADIHLIGKNSRYIVNKDGNNPTIDNFEPMQVLGQKLGGLVVGEFGLALTGRY
ncbi:MAG: hypothetical protein JXR96_23270 [Deltaproteobacteria bacterium]|nr:hypothetical protein [Deltaproteobacteria bacterium]